MTSPRSRVVGIGRPAPSWKPMLLAASMSVVTALAWFSTFDDASEAGTAVLGGYRERWFCLNLLLTDLSIWLLLVAGLRLGRHVSLKILVGQFAIVCALGLFEVLAIVDLVDYRELIPTGHIQHTHSEDERLRRCSEPGLDSTGTAYPDLVNILGAEGDGVPYHIQTDRYGLRNARDKEAPEVIALGDSILVAGLLPIEEIVTERLERRLRRSVLNVSEVQYSPQEELARFETTGLGVENRLVLQFIFEGNDLQDSERWRTWRAGGSTASWPRSGLLKSLLQRIHRPKRAAGARRVGLFAQADGREVPVWFLYVPSRVDEHIAEFASLRCALVQARDRFVSAGGRYAIVFVPCKLSVLRPGCRWPEGSELDEAAGVESAFSLGLRQLCEEQGIPLLDMTPALRAVSAGGELPFFPADTHLNSRGHQALAESLDPWVTGLLPRAEE